MLGSHSSRDIGIVLIVLKNYAIVLIRLIQSRLQSMTIIKHLELKLQPCQSNHPAHAASSDAARRAK